MQTRMAREVARHVDALFTERRRKTYGACGEGYSGAGSTGMSHF